MLIQPIWFMHIGIHIHHINFHIVNSIISCVKYSMPKLSLTEQEKQKIRELCDWLSTRTECTRLEAAQAIGVEPDVNFHTRIWWPAVKALWSTQAWRSEGGGSRYKVADWKGKWTSARRTIDAAKSRFSRARDMLPSDDETPEHKRRALGRARDHMATSDWAVVEREDAKRKILATTDFKGLLGKSDTPRN